MSGSLLIAWIATAAATLTAVTYLWARLVRPAIRSLTELAALIRELVGITRSWPRLSATVADHTSEFSNTTLLIGETAGELRAADKNLKRDLDELWKQHRALAEAVRHRPAAARPFAQQPLGVPHADPSP